MGFARRLKSGAAAVLGLCAVVAAGGTDAEVLYQRYGKALQEFEAGTHTDKEAAEFLTTWRAKFETLARQQKGEEAASAYAHALLLALNAYRAGLLDDAYSRSGVLVADALERCGDAKGTEEVLEWFCDLAAESGNARTAAAVLARSRATLSGRSIECALTYGIGDMLCAGGDADGACREFARVVERWPDSRYARRSQREIRELRVLVIGEPAPAFELRDTAGTIHTRESCMGRPVWIYVYSDSCGWCVTQRDRMEAIARDLAARGVQVLFVQVGTTTQEDREDATRHDWPRIRLEHSQTPHPFETAYNAHRVPRTFAIDAAGRFVGKDVPIEEIGPFWDKQLAGTPAQRPH